MNRELEKLVQQYADLYPYDPSKQPPPQSQAPVNILAAPMGAPPDQSRNIPVEQRPPVLNPIAKDLQLLPVQPALRTLDTQKVGEQLASRNRIIDMCSGDNLYRLVLGAVIVICLIMYFRKK
jgi:hypothetical protein